MVDWLRRQCKTVGQIRKSRYDGEHAKTTIRAVSSKLVQGTADGEEYPE